MRSLPSLMDKVCSLSNFHSFSSFLRWPCEARSSSTVYLSEKTPDMTRRGRMPCHLSDHFLFFSTNCFASRNDLIYARNLCQGFTCSLPNKIIIVKESAFDFFPQCQYCHTDRAVFFQRSGPKWHTDTTRFSITMWTDGSLYFLGLRE